MTVSRPKRMMRNEDKESFFALVNLISVLVIALAVVVLIIVLLTKPGEAPNIAGYSALLHYNGKYGANVWC